MKCYFSPERIYFFFRQDTNNFRLTLILLRIEMFRSWVLVAIRADLFSVYLLLKCSPSKSLSKSLRAHRGPSSLVDPDLSESAVTKGEKATPNARLSSLSFLLQILCPTIPSFCKSLMPSKLLNFFPRCLVPSGNLTGHRTHLNWGFWRRLWGGNYLELTVGKDHPCPTSRHWVSIWQGCKGKRPQRLSDFSQGES